MIAFMPRARNEGVIAAFAKTLKEARQQQRLSQEALADQAALDRTFIGLLESGKRQPTLSVICALAHALHETPAQLVQRAVTLAEVIEPGSMGAKSASEGE